MALPLIVEGEVLGALVLYASELEALRMSDPGPFASLADMLALAFESVRNRAQEQQEAAAAPKELSRASEPADLPFGGGKRAQYRPSGQGESRSEDNYTAPIKMRGSVIGSMNFRGASEETLGPDELELIESVSDQVGQAIENLSLLEDAQRIARREQLINEITGRLQRATSVDEVLRTAAESVRRALGDVEVTARLTPETVEAVVTEDVVADENEAT
jgi:GAF domain-containing protein